MNLEQLFSTFHDFDIVSLDYQKDNLVMTLRIPWGEMWDDFDYQIHVELINSKIIKCEFFEYIDQDDPNVDYQNRKIADKETDNLEEIEQLQLDIQRHSKISDNEYIFYCNGYDKVGGGQIYLTAESFKLYDRENNPIVDATYHKWFKDWWDNIFKT